MQTTVRTCTADELIALCDEIAALVRAGLPLEQMLALRGRSFPRRLGKHVQELAAKMETGQSLADAVRKDPFFPPLYAAVLAAGIESGHPAVALETIAQNTRMLRDARAFIVRTTVYPVLLLSVLWALLGTLLYFAIPPFLAFFENFEIHFPLAPLMTWLADSPERYLWGVFGGLGLFWLVYIFWAFGTRQATAIHATPTLLGFLPWIGRAHRELQKATFARQAAMLLQHEIPRERALLLAAQTLGRQVLPRSPADAMDATQSERVEDAPEYPRSAVSSLIRWARGINDPKLLVEGLHRYADIAERIARLQIDRCELWFPVLTLFGVALCISAAYLATIVWPYGTALWTAIQLK